MGILLQGGSANIADIQFEGGSGNKTVIIPKEGGKLAVGTNLSGATAYHLLQGDLSVSNELITTGFSTALYTSGGATTGVNMITLWGNNASETFGGLVWLKDRVEATNNFLYDTVRGTTKEINSNTTEAEATLAGGLTAFNLTGFTVGADAGHNSTTNNMVSWNFQTTHRRTGTTNHGKAFTEHYNPFTGFTIIKYEGSGLAGHEIPHSLGRKLGFVTVKNLSAVSSWTTQYRDSNYLSLNLANAETALSSASIFSDNNITAGAENTSTNQYILYGWANSYFDESNKIIGNYEIGVYPGTGVAGNKVTTKGKPAWVIIKRLDVAGDWVIKDNLRGSTKLLYANVSVTEETDQNVDFSVDWFTIQNTNTDMNASGGQYLYMVVYDNDSGSGKSKYPKATDTSNLTINNAIIPFAQGFDSNGTKVSTLSKNETITGLTYTAGKNYVYAKLDGTYGVKPYRPRYLRCDLVAEKAGDNPDYFDVLKNKWFSTNVATNIGDTITINAEITTGRNYLNTIVYADASGQLIYEEELPKVEYKDRVKANEYRGKNACTAWVLADCSTTPPTILDKHNVSSFIRLNTGEHRVTFLNQMDTLNYGFSYGGKNSVGYLNMELRRTLSTFDVSSFNVAGTAGNSPLLYLEFMGGKN